MSMARFQTRQHTMVAPATHPNDMKQAAPRYRNGSHGDCHKGWTRSPASSISAPERRLVHARQQISRGNNPGEKVVQCAFDSLHPGSQSGIEVPEPLQHRRKYSRNRGNHGVNRHADRDLGQRRMQIPVPGEENPVKVPAGDRHRCPAKAGRSRKRGNWSAGPCASACADACGGIPRRQFLPRKRPNRAR